MTKNENNSQIVSELLQYREAAFLLAFRIIGNRADAEDAVQEGYLRAVRYKGEIQQGPQSRAWLLRIVGNAARDMRSSRKSRTGGESKFAIENALKRHSSERAVPQTEKLREAVAEAVAGLQEHLRVPVSLHYEQGLSYAEAAKVLNIPEGTLRVYASRGLQTMRERLERTGYGLSPLVLLGMLEGGGVSLPADFSAKIDDILRSAATSRKTAVTTSANRHLRYAAVLALFGLAPAVAVTFMVYPWSAAPRSHEHQLIAANVHPAPPLAASPAAAIPETVSSSRKNEVFVEPSSAPLAPAQSTPAEETSMTIERSPSFGAELPPAPAPFESRQEVAAAERAATERGMQPASKSTQVSAQPAHADGAKVLLPFCGGVIDRVTSATELADAKDRARQLIKAGIEVALSRHPATSPTLAASIRNSGTQDVWLNMIVKNATQAASMRPLTSTLSKEQRDDTMVWATLISIDEKFIETFVIRTIEAALPVGTPGTTKSPAEPHHRTKVAVAK